MQADKRFGLIILGNSGVGKSFLANILLGRNYFKHEYSCDSVTHVTEFQEVVVGKVPFAIFNIPGLIEVDQARINMNKKEIDKAFAQRPNSIIIFVFGQQHGRMKEEDIVTFNAIKKAYPFQLKSLVIVVNGLNKKRPASYDGQVLTRLQELLKGTNVNERNVCFLDEINDENPKEKQILKERFIQILVEFTPSFHKKEREIETVRDELNKQKELIVKQQQQFEATVEKQKEKIKQNEKKINEMTAKHKSETESLRQAIKRQEQSIAQLKKSNEEARNRPPQIQYIYEDSDDDDGCIIS